MEGELEDKPEESLSWCFQRKWVGLELNQQRNMRLFYRQVPTPVGEPTQKLKVPTGLEPAIACLKDKSLNLLRTALRREFSLHTTSNIKPRAIKRRDQDLNLEPRFWRPRCCRYTISAFSWSGGSRTHTDWVMSPGLYR